MGNWYRAQRHCHTFTDLSTLPVTQVFPRMSMQVTKWSCTSSSFLNCLPYCKSHILMDLSSDTESKYLLLGWNTKSVTQLSWPRKVMRQMPWRASKSLTVLSRLPETTYCLVSLLSWSSTCKVSSGTCCFSSSSFSFSCLLYLRASFFFLRSSFIFCILSLVDICFSSDLSCPKPWEGSSY